MKTLRIFACGLAAACVLSSCAYDDHPYGYVTTYPSYVGPTYYRTGYYSYDSPYTWPTYTNRSYYPRTYVTNRYLQPVTTRTYLSSDPLASRMSVGGYGYIQPAPRPEPWPLR